jgi:hypothetical protein
MTACRSHEHLPPAKADEELIQAMQHWGERDLLGSTTSGSVIQRNVAAQTRRNRLITLIASSVMVSAILSTAWMALSGRNANLPTNVAMKPDSVDNAPERLMESITERLGQMESQMEEWDARWEQRKNTEREIEELHASLLQCRRIAIRNRLATLETP